jgi:hypothetical protein
MSTQLALSSPFSLLGATSPLADVVTPPCRVTLSFNGDKTSSLSLLHLSTMIYLITSLLKPKPKHEICTTATNHPPQTVRLS